MFCKLFLNSVHGSLYFNETVCKNPNCHSAADEESIFLTYLIKHEILRTSPSG